MYVLDPIARLASPDAEGGAQLIYDVVDYAISSDATWVAFSTTSPNTAPAEGAVAGVPMTACVSQLKLGSSHRLVIAGAAAPSPANAVATVRNFVFQPGTHRLALQCELPYFPSTNFLQVLDLDTGAVDFQLATPATRALNSPLAFSADGQTLAFAVASSSLQGEALQTWRADRGVQAFTRPATGAMVPAIELAVSPDGSRVAFTSLDPGLSNPPTPTNVVQLYEAQLTTGELRLLSAGPGGEAVGGVEICRPQYRPDGRSLVFQSTSPAFTPEDRNRTTDVFLREAVTGAITLMSASAKSGYGASSGWSSLIQRGLSIDGRRVLFLTTAPDLLPDGTSDGPDLLVHDRVTGENLHVNVVPGENGPERASFGEAVLSGNGRYVAFVSTGLVLPGAGVSFMLPQVYVRDVVLGTVRLASVAMSGSPSTGNTFFQLRISADGRFVAFYTDALDLARGSTRNGNAILRDMIRQRTYLVDANNAPLSRARSNTLALADVGGRVVAARTGSQVFQAVVFDAESGESEVLTGEVGTSVALSRDGSRLVLAKPTRPFGVRWRKLPGGEWHELTPQLDGFLTIGIDGLSADGRLAVIRDRTPRARGRVDYLLDLATGGIESLETTPDGSGSMFPSARSLSPDADGTSVAFQSWANDLIVGHSNPWAEIFLRDRVAARTVLMSAAGDGSPADDASFSPLMSADGRTLVFSSWAGNLAAEDGDGASDILALDLRPRAFADSDGDGVDDHWERAWFGNLARDGAGDYDGDGGIERSEYAAGTSPLDDLSTFRIEILRTFAEGTTLAWNSVRGRRYQLYARAELAAQPAPAGEVVVGDGKRTRLSLPAPTEARQFFQIAILP